MANYWLHFIGQKYYTRQAFIKEALTYGASRRVSLADLKKMAWDDVVLCAMYEKKKSVLFGMFKIKRLSGLSKEATAVLEKFFGLEKVDDGGLRVRRGCGEYITGPEYRVNATLAEIAEVLDALKRQGVDIGKPLIGGPFKLHSPVVRLASIPHRQGFRLFDYQALQAALQQASGKKMPAVRGQFYVSAVPGRGPRGGAVQEVQDYQLRTTGAA